MLSLPISADTFKKSFLDGNGQIEINSDQDAWQALFTSKAPFNPTVDRVADLTVRAGANKPLTLGGAGSLKIGLSGGVEAMHQIQLIWPDSTVDPIITRGLKPDPQQVLVRLLLHGKADASVKGSSPIGPLQSTFGVTAGGSIACERLKIFAQTTPAQQILLEMFAGLRLPQQVKAATDIPVTGEVLLTRFGGYLTVSGQVSYGYSISGSREIALGQLNLDLDYKLKLAAGLTTSFKLAGEFEVETTAGSKPNFVRYVVRKSRDSQFNFAADCGFDSELHLKGLPDTSDEFLAKALGATGESVLALFEGARTYSNIDELENAAGKLCIGAVHELSQLLIGKALDNTTLAEFANAMARVVDVYNNADSRVIHLYEDYLDRIPQLTSTLNILAQATSPETLKEITDSLAWDLVNRLAGPRLYDILLEEGAFASFSKLVKEARSFVTDGAKKEIRDVIARLKHAFPLDSLLQQLQGVTTADQLKDLADVKLQGLVESLLNKSFEKIRKSDAGKVINDLHDTIEKVAAFKETYYRKVVEAANRSYHAQLHFAYARATTRSALLDVEIDVSTGAGQELARLAGGGDFAGVLAKFKSSLVRINKSVLTHSLTSSTQLQINIFGYGIEGFTRVIQKTDEALEVHDGGLLHIYTTQTQLDERRKHGGELTSTSFLFATVAKALQSEGSREFLIRTLPKMSAQYDFLKEDDRTKPEEMREILDLAAALDIVDPVKFTDSLRAEFPNGLGKVSAKYVVRYDSDAVSSAFQIKDGPKRENLQSLAVNTMRSFISAKYTAMPQTHSQALLGFAYANPETFNLFRTLGFASFTNNRVGVTLPGWFTKGSPRTVELQAMQKQALVTLYSVERNFVDRLLKLDAVIDGLRDGTEAVSADELNKNVRRFVEMTDDLSFGRENAFFVVFDRLVLEGTGAKSPRNSALVLEITPPGGQKVTKVLTAAKPAAVADLASTTIAEPTVASGAGA